MQSGVPGLLVETCVSLVEAIDTTGRIDKLLGTGKEWVASRADFNCKVLGSGLCLDDIATGTLDLSEFIVRMDISLHNSFLLQKIIYILHSLLSQGTRFHLTELMI